MFVRCVLFFDYNSNENKAFTWQPSSFKKWHHNIKEKKLSCKVILQFKKTYGLKEHKSHTFWPSSKCLNWDFLGWGKKKDSELKNWMVCCFKSVKLKSEK